MDEVVIPTTIVNKCAEPLDCGSQDYRQHKIVAPGETVLVNFKITQISYNNYWIYIKGCFINLPHVVIMYKGENGPNPKITFYDREFPIGLYLDGSDTTAIGKDGDVQVHNMCPNRILVKQYFASFYLPPGKSVGVPRDQLSVRVEGRLVFVANSTIPTRFSHYDGRNLSFW